MKERWKNRIVGTGEVAPDQLLANDQNFRRHPKHQQEAMRGVLDEIGFVQNVIVNRITNRVVDGHLRIELALRHDQPTIPVVYVELTEAEELLALATLDPIGAMAETDREVLGKLLGDLENRPDALKGLLDNLAKQAGGIDQEPGAGNTDPDAAPAVPYKPTSRLGDLWILGDHRLLVADATKGVNVARAVGNEPAACLWTDPPYGVAYEGAAGTIENDDLPPAQFAVFLGALFKAAAVGLRKGGAFYVAHADSERVAFEAALRAAELTPRQNLIWVKQSAPLSRQDYNWRHEPMLYGWRDGAAHYFGFDFTATTVLDQGESDVKRMSRESLEALAVLLLGCVPTSTLYVDRPARSELHPTMKPIALIERCLGHSTRPGELVLDVCAGSGSTIIAAERLKRRAAALELDPQYADVAVMRWQDFTGAAAHLEGDTGRTFDAVAKARSKERKPRSTAPIKPRKKTA